MRKYIRSFFSSDLAIAQAIAGHIYSRPLASTHASTQYWDIFYRMTDRMNVIENQKKTDKKQEFTRKRRL
jgi:hypothetical protein